MYSNTLATWCENWLIAKDPDVGKDWGQEKKGMTEDEMVGWHHWLDGHESEQALEVNDGQGSLACCNPWGHKESDMTERLTWTDSACLWRPSAPLTILSKGCCQMVWVYLSLSWSWRDASPIFLFIEKCRYITASTFWDHLHQSVIRGLGRPAILPSSLTKQKVLCGITAVCLALCPSGSVRKGIDECFLAGCCIKWLHVCLPDDLNDPVVALLLIS